MEDKSHIYANIFSGNYSPEDLAWYESEVANRPEEVEQYRALWELTSTYTFTEATSTNDSWEQLKKRKQPIKEKTVFAIFTSNYFRWSAAAILAVGLFSLFYFSQQKGSTDLAIHVYTESYEAKLGNVKVVSLSDGSTVKLNSGSVLKIDKDFNNKSRSVLLEGEAFFEVTPNKQVPFIIETGANQVRVIGTSFNISNFKGSPFTVAVKSGVVNVKTIKSEVNLIKGQKAVSDEAKVLFVSQYANEDEFSWINGDFSFDNTLLKDVISEIERHFNVSVSFDKKLCDQKYTGTFKNKSLEEIVQVLEAVFKTKITVSSN